MPFYGTVLVTLVIKFDRNLKFKQLMFFSLLVKFRRNVLDLRFGVKKDSSVVIFLRFVVKNYFSLTTGGFVWFFENMILLDNYNYNKGRLNDDTFLSHK